MCPLPLSVQCRVLQVDPGRSGGPHCTLCCRKWGWCSDACQAHQGSCRCFRKDGGVSVGTGWVPLAPAPPVQCLTGSQNAPGWGHVTQSLSGGQSPTAGLPWRVPHCAWVVSVIFASILLTCLLCPQHPTDVDYRVMATFTEFYTTLLGFVNFRLYQSLNLHYPPKVGPASPAPTSLHRAAARQSPRGGRAGPWQAFPLTFPCLPARGSGPRRGEGP